MILCPNVKLNLGLYVLAKRPDGYHELDTLFIPHFGIRDRLEIEEAEEFSITIRREGGVDWDPLQDLCARAYRLLRDEFNIPSVSIDLTKNIPVGAGLGGGSADAAFTLKALNEIFALGLDNAALASRAALLGSDCPFFIYNVPMRGTGRGEILTPFDIDLSAFDIRVEIPAGVAVSTREAYAGIRPGYPEIGLVDALRRPAAQWKDVLRNDFEAAIFPQHKEIAALKERLYGQGAVYAAMSGSGSAVFGLF